MYQPQFSLIFLIIRHISTTDFEIRSDDNDNYPLIGFSFSKFNNM